MHKLALLLFHLCTRQFISDCRILAKWTERTSCHSLVQKERSNMKKKVICTTLPLYHYTNILLKTNLKHISRDTFLQSYDSNYFSQPSWFLSHRLISTDVTTWNHTQSPLLLTFCLSLWQQMRSILYFPPLRHPSVKLKTLQNQPT